VVLDVLKDIGAGGHPILTVYNKADLIGSAARPDADKHLVSAVSGEGLESLVQEIVHRVSPVNA
jgi:50S ribosomal subunit-associated GTPase HflX